MTPLKRRLRNLLVLAGDQVSRRRTGARVVTLHDVPSRAALHDRLSWLQRFHRIRPLRDLLSEPGEAAVALTFDDGYASWHDVAMPVLRELSLPATFFVCSGFVGLAADQAESFVKQRIRRTRRLVPLTRDQLRRLAEIPDFEIGSHTVNHADFSTVAPAEIAGEIQRDRDQLEAMTGRRVSMFAYPFGQAEHARDEAKSALADAGFESAFTIVPQFVNDAADRFSIGRDSLDLTDSERVWSASLRGSYDALYRIRHRP